MTSKKGFTLIELMVTIAVASILLVVGAPSLTSLYETTRAEQSIKKIQSTMAFARNQAMSYNLTISLCPKAKNRCGTNWKSGLQVFLIQQQSSLDENGQPVVKDRRVVLRQIDAFNSKDLVKLNFSQLQFFPNGQIAFVANNNAIDNNVDQAQLVYCPSKRSNENSQAVEIHSGGATRIINSGVNCSTGA